MKRLNKLFGGIDLNWKKLIIFAIIAGIYTAIMAMLPIAEDTSFSDLTARFEVWILFGILIIMNSKSAKDSAMKCFVFFLISQPLVYLVQDVINHSNLFITYYRYWFMWTIATIPMGFVGYFIKKDKWWGLVFILTPILLFLGEHYANYLSETMFSFPRHLLTTIFCFVTLIIYPIAIFKNKKIQIAGTIISSVIIIAMTIISCVNPAIYNTDILSSGGEYQFDNTYKAYLTDSKYGDLSIRYEDGIESYLIHARFRKEGKTEFVLESPSGEKTIFEINIKRDTYDIEKKESANSSLNEKDQELNVKLDNQWKSENVKITVKEDSITKTGATITIEDKNESPKSWGMNFAVQISAGNDKWEDLIIKETISWVEMLIAPNEKGITEMQLDWHDMYGELNQGTYRIVKYNGLSTIYSEPFTIK